MLTQPWPPRTHALNYPWRGYGLKLPSPGSPSWWMENAIGYKGICVENYLWVMRGLTVLSSMTPGIIETRPLIVLSPINLFANFHYFFSLSLSSSLHPFGATGIRYI